MRSLFVAWLLAQTLLLKPSAQYIAVTTSSSAPTVAKGGTVTLWADVAPKPNMHVYATSKQGFTPVTLAIAPQPHLTAGKVAYPPAENGITPGTDMLVPIPIYSHPFRITVPVSVSSAAKPGETITIAGAVNYQACSDRVCFSATSLPVTWELTVK